MKHLTLPDMKEIISNSKAEIASARTRFIRQRLILIGLHKEISNKDKAGVNDKKILDQLIAIIEHLDDILDSMEVV